MIKPIKPLNPQQYRVYSLKQNVEKSKLALKNEKERQKRQKEQERLRKSRMNPQSQIPHWWNVKKYVDLGGFCVE